MNAIDVLGWIGNVLIVAGLWGVGNKFRIFFIVSAVGNLAWFTVAHLRHDWTLAPLCVVLGALSVRGYFKWRKSE